MAESSTQGLVGAKLSNLPGYASNQDIELNGITWFKEDSYKDNFNYKWLEARFAKASKNQKGIDRGTPDHTVVKRDSNIIVIIESKQSTKKHSRFDNVEEYITNGYGNAKETENYAIDGALWYAEFLKDSFDVIAIAVSGVSEADSKVTTFVYPQHGEISDIKLMEDGSLLNCLTTIVQYEKDIEVILDRNNATEKEIMKNLRTYTLACANFLRANGIEDNSKAGFVSAIILGLTNKESRLYKVVKSAYDRKQSTRSLVMDRDDMGRESVKLLKEALYGNGKEEYDDDYVAGLFDIDKIPKGKRKSLKKFYDILLNKDELTKTPKSMNRKTFVDGSTVLSACIYSLYEHVVLITEKYSGIDVMGEFYTTFLRFTKGNAKEKGIVLTPSHITTLFCDIAEYYSGKKFDEQTKILDICTGTGGFLIASLDRIKNNIEALPITPNEKEKKYSLAQKNCLIGVERDSPMYSLAYANMRFHGDGKSNLFNCSSLMSDSFLSTDGSGDAYIGTEKMSLDEALKTFGPIDIGMINPPYSLKDDDKTKKEYPVIIELHEKEEALKKANKSKDKKAIEKAKYDIEIVLNNIKSSHLDEIVIQKGQSELDFVASMLHYIKEGGIGIAIVPMSCAGNADKKLRAEILKHHTLLACMTMPNQLFFDSHVGVATCIMVFKAHIPHDVSKAIFFARWKDDGFKVITHNGRKKTERYNDIHKEWMEELDGTASPNDKVWMRHRISNLSEDALAEAFVKTDYSKLTDSDFEKTLKKFALFKYMDEEGLLEV